MKIVFATGNKNKMKEIREILRGLGMDIISMADAGVSDDIVEDGTTFEENSMIKAKGVAAALLKADPQLASEAIVMADDSGLEVDYLNKEPGVYSARYMGKDTSYTEKNNNIISRLEGVPDEKRTARFVCAISAVLPDGRDFCVREAMEGRIGYEIAGSNGFGYDPIFFLPEYGKTSAEISPEEKNAISHRGKALRAMEKILGQELK
ncbi:RdgB/HAM1 family non-canonical purine NTP pyrophosphatase [Butyrivibrio sp. MC2021]|uniref:RdgB/HAM1 family non-canonical purine NTP pyrophosphatase n=1 Tax=Butyrivibrio sp. MC2021 TaxID=1408306 RepID=UPI0004798CB6|nr:RdgB/HAM1 family non-canonical purine NTP pyrophosphatase [Butyrivibrio sp. MC2021]